MKRKIRLKDGSFPGSNSATLAGDNAGQSPEYFNWVRDGDALLIFYTDMCLGQAVEDNQSIKKIAWLIEPPEINSTSYQFCRDNEELFSYILTHIKEYAHLGPKWLFYPFGGSWIQKDKWTPWVKNKDVSIIVSEKRLTTGHKLRHEAVDMFYDRVDVMGRGYDPIASKLKGLASYRYSIIIENVRRDWWFTEKLIDCFSVGTIPIYWGVPNIGKFFDKRGMICFENLTELSHILARIGEDDYQSRIGAINRNRQTAATYRCCEDWLWLNCPYLFTVK